MGINLSTFSTASQHPNPLGGGHPLYAQAAGSLASSTQKTQILALNVLPSAQDEMVDFFQGRYHTMPFLVTTWEALGAKIKAASPIGKLAIYSHGAPGQIRIGTQEYGIEQDNVRQFFLGTCDAVLDLHTSCKRQRVAGTAFCQEHQPKTPQRGWVGPRAESIEFEGCTVGQSPTSLATFGRLLAAKSVSGFTWFHAASKQGVTIPKGTTVEAISKLIQPFQKYLFAGQPTVDELASKSRSADYKCTMRVEYFFRDQTDRPQGIPTGAVARGEVKKREVAKSEISALEDEYEAELNVPCELVVVKI